MTRILVAEDSPTQAYQIRRKLTDEGYDVEVVENGRKALQMIPTYWPHLILTDMQMPVMGGLELVEVSSSRYPVIPLVLITARGSDRIAAEALRRGAAAYLPKSLMEQRLFETIDDVLEALAASQCEDREVLSPTSENQYELTIENDPRQIAPLVRKIQQTVADAVDCDDTECVRIGMAVHHAIRNAMLHGNLELTAQDLDPDEEIVVDGEKSVIERRAEQDGYRDRRTHLTMELAPRDVRITVRDDGQGFDLKSIPAAVNVDILDPENGRGLVLIASVMDEVKLNETGNEITMIKRVQQRASV